MAPPIRGHFSDSGKNGNISSEDNCQAAHLIEYGDGQTEHLADEWVRAGDGDNDRVLTEEIIYDARPTEGCQERTGECQGGDSTPCVGTGH